MEQWLQLNQTTEKFHHRFHLNNAKSLLLFLFCVIMEMVKCRFPHVKSYSSLSFIKYNSKYCSPFSSHHPTSRTQMFSFTFLRKSYFLWKSNTKKHFIRLKGSHSLQMCSTAFFKKKKKKERNEAKIVSVREIKLYQTGQLKSRTI